MKRFHHGTNMVINSINLEKGRSRTDFGKGFYLGNNLGVARKWAISQSMATEIPTVMRYVLSDVVFKFDGNSLSRLWFTSPTVEWLNFVRDNRREIATNTREIEPRHSYDVVFEPVANDKVVDVVDEYIDGILSADEAIRRVRVIPSVFQMSFHTPLALTYIDQTLTEFQQRIQNSKWSVWEKM